MNVERHIHPELFGSSFGTVYEAEDEIDAKREELIQEVERRLQQRQECVTLFSVRWRIAWRLMPQLWRIIDSDSEHVLRDSHSNVL